MINFYNLRYMYLKWSKYLRSELSTSWIRIVLFATALSTQGKLFNKYINLFKFCNKIGRKSSSYEWSVSLPVSLFKQFLAISCGLFLRLLLLFALQSFAKLRLLFAGSVCSDPRSYAIFYYNIWGFLMNKEKTNC